MPSLAGPRGPLRESTRWPRPHRRQVDLNSVRAAAVVEPMEARRLLHGAVDVSIDFKPASAQADTGHFADVGLPYGNRGQGMTYGWSRHTGPRLNTWSRDLDDAPTRALGTLIMAGWAADLRWEMALPAGLYEVTLSIAEPLSANATRLLATIEGLPARKSTVAQDDRFATASARVNVVDGRLTIIAADGLANTGLASVRIAAVHDENKGAGGGGIASFRLLGGINENNGHVEFQAESFTGQAPGSGIAAGHVWTPVSDSTAGGGTALRADPNLNVNTLEGLIGPRRDYAINFTTTGTYYVWVRLKGTIDNDSVHLGIDGTGLSLGRYGVGDPGGAWKWLDNIGNGGRMTVNITSPGTRTFNLWMREDGVQIDAFVLTKNATFRPTGGGGDDGGGDDGGGDDGGGAFQEVAGKVVIQAEAFTAQASGTGAATGHSWNVVPDSTALGGSVLASTPNVGINTLEGLYGPRRDYAINFTTTGTYYAWVRLKGILDNDSVHVGLNGVAASLGRYGVGDASGQWKWLNSIGNGSRLTVSVATLGQHTFNLWMREDGVQIDALVLSRDPSFNPNNGLGDDGGGGGGGGGDDDTTGTPSLGSWTVHANMPVAMMEGAIAQVNGQVYLWGGFNSGSTWLSQKHGYRFNPATRTWTRIADLPEPVTHGKAIEHNGRIFFFGGYSNNADLGSFLGNTDAVYVYDPATNRFSLWGRMPIAISGHGGVKVGSRVHILGGHLRNAQNQFISNSTAHFSIDLDNPAAGWQTKPDVPAGRDHVGAVATEGAIWYFAGQSNDNEYSGVQDDTWRYDLASRAWSARALVPQDGVGHIDQASLAYAGHPIIVAGNVNGPAGANYTDRVLCYDPAADAWSILGRVPEWRRGVQATVIDDVLWVFGGGTGYPRNNVWSAPLSVV